MNALRTKATNETWMNNGLRFKKPLELSAANRKQLEVGKISILNYQFKIVIMLLLYYHLPKCQIILTYFLDFFGFFCFLYGRYLVYILIIYYYCFSLFPSISSNAFSVASFATSGSMWAYTCSVILIDEWPSFFETTDIGAPLDKSHVPNVLRKSWM